MEEREANADATRSRFKAHVVTNAYAGITSSDARRIYRMTEKIREKRFELLRVWDEVVG
ncbi:hypothetical protein C1H46_034687 [Malus baccata]|uniref:Uncharacterized protein n=1 Tax=Malus baccata TaxID=106549 RepID=A0A540KZV6_MALBA|nr:hypothetical protein C1H46_034687 [Malus baccata]